MDRNFGAESAIALEQLKIWLEKAVRAYKIAFVLLVIGAIVLVILGVKLNRWDMAGGNFILALIFLTVWGFFTFHPVGLLAAFGIGGVKGLPQDWSINQFIRQGTLPDLQLSEVVHQGFEFIKKLSLYAIHVAFFMTVMFVVLGTFELKTAKAVLPVFIALAGIGLWCILADVPPKWYLRITSAILFVSLAIFLYKGFVSGDDETVKAPSARDIKEKWSFSQMFGDWGYKKTVVFQKSDLHDYKLCGVRPGSRTFEIQGKKVIVLLQKPGFRPEQSDITSFLLVNDTIEGEPFEVKDDGCVTVSTSYSQGMKETNTFVSQRIGLTFK